MSERRNIIFIIIYTIIYVMFGNSISFALYAGTSTRIPYYGTIENKQFTMGAGHIVSGETGHIVTRETGHIDIGQFQAISQFLQGSRFDLNTRRFFRKFLGDILPVESEFTALTNVSDEGMPAFFIPDFLISMGVTRKTQLSRSTQVISPGLTVTLYTFSRGNLRYTFTDPILLDNAQFLLTRINIGGYTYSLLNRKAMDNDSYDNTTYWIEGDIFEELKGNSVEGLFDILSDVSKDTDFAYFIYEKTQYLYNHDGPGSRCSITRITPEGDVQILDILLLNNRLTIKDIKDNDGNDFTILNFSGTQSNQLKILTPEGDIYDYSISDSISDAAMTILKNGKIWQSIEDYKLSYRTFDISGIIDYLGELARVSGLEAVRTQLLRSVVPAESFDIKEYDSAGNRLSWRHIRTNYAQKVGIDTDGRALVIKFTENISLDSNGQPDPHGESEYYGEYMLDHIMEYAPTVARVAFDEEKLLGISLLYREVGFSLIAYDYIKFKPTRFPITWRTNSVENWIINFASQDYRENTAWTLNVVYREQYRVLEQNGSIFLRLGRTVPTEGGGFDTTWTNVRPTEGIPKLWKEFLDEINSLLGTHYDATKIGREEIIIDIPQQIKVFYNEKGWGFTGWPFTGRIIVYPPRFDVLIERYKELLFGPLLHELKIRGITWTMQEDGSLIIHPKK